MHRINHKNVSTLLMWKFTALSIQICQSGRKHSIIWCDNNINSIYKFQGEL